MTDDVVRSTPPADLRVTWSIDWPQLAALLAETFSTERERRLVRYAWPYHAELLSRRGQQARILLARRRPGASGDPSPGAPWVPNKHPLDIYVGALAGMCYHFGFDRVPDGYFCERIAVGGPVPPAGASYNAAGELVLVRSQLRLHFRVGPSHDVERRPRAMIRHAFMQTDLLPEAEVWPWIFAGFEQSGGDVGSIAHWCAPIDHYRHDDPHVPPAPLDGGQALNAPGLAFQLDGRRGPRLIIVYATKCPTCRRIYWGLFRGAK